MTATITLTPGTTHQTWNHWEATYWAAAYGTPPNSGTYQGQPCKSWFPTAGPLIENALTNLGIARIRVGDIMPSVEYTEDYWAQLMAGTITWAQYDDLCKSFQNDAGPYYSRPDWLIDVCILPLKAKLAAVGISLKTQIVIYPRAIHPSEYVFWDHADVWADYVVALWDHFAARYDGWTPEYLGLINEPNNFAGCNGTKLATCAVAIQAALATAGYSPKFIIPSCSTTQTTLTYLTDFIAETGGAWITANVLEFACHLYDSAPGDLAAIAALADTYSVQTSQLEHINAGVDELHEHLTVLNASSWQEMSEAGIEDIPGANYFEYDTATPSVIEWGTHTRLYYQYMHYIQEGAVRFDATSDDGAVKPTAWAYNGMHVVVARCTAAKSISIDGLLAGTYRIQYSTGGAPVELSPQTITTGQAVTVAMPGAGVVTIYNQSLFNDEATLTLQPNAAEGKDTFVASDLPTENFGAATSLTLNPTLIRRSLIGFDLSAIPAGSVCVSANLHFYHHTQDTNQPWTVTIHSIASGNAAWIEGTRVSGQALAGEPCWNALAANGSGGVTTPWAGSAGLGTSGTDYEAAAIGSFSGNRSDAVGTEYIASLTAARVEGWFGNPNTNYGMLLVSDAGTGNMCSSDHAISAYRPKLVVTYVPPPANWANWVENEGDGSLVDEPTLVHGGSHAAKATAGVSADTYVYQDATVTAGKLYKLTFWTRGDGTYAGRYRVYDNTNAADTIALASTAVPGTTYAQVTAYFTAPAGCSSVRLYLECPSAAGGIAYFDDVSIKEVTHVGATGVHIVSAVGTTRNWLTIPSGFDYNGPTYTFTVTCDFIGDEALYWIDGGGTYHLLGQGADEKTFYTEWSDFDLPPIDYQEQQIPDYHGVTYKGHRYQARVMNVGILLHPGGTLTTLWDQRATVIGWLSPELGEGALLHVRKATGGGFSCRMVDCRVLGSIGMNSAQRRSGGTGGQFGVLQFRATYPFWYDPVQQSASVALNGATPVTLAVTNGGQIYTFPEIKIAATANVPRIAIQGDAVNYLEITRNVSADYITVYTERGNKRVLTSAGVDITNLVTAESKFFSLPVGATTLELSCTSGTGTVTVSWYDFFLGI